MGQSTLYPMLYKVGDQAVVYSVGSDLDDDGGVVTRK